MEKLNYAVRRAGKVWEVVHLATGRSIGSRNTRKEARELRQRYDRLLVERRNREEFDADTAPRG